MNKTALYFLDDKLILPTDFPDSGIINGIPLEFAGELENPDIFEIPPLDASPAVNAVSVHSLPQNWRSISVRQALASGHCTSGIIRACHIMQWRQESVFCGRCGARNNDVSGGVQRLCPKCGKEEFPRICPAVIVLITDSTGRILLAHNKKFKAGLYSLVSGFNETGETLEETVIREIKEEININVNKTEYAGSQPWPFPNSLMIGFKAQYLSGTLKPDGVEIEDAAWFTKDSLPDLPAEGSLSRYLINLWLEKTKA